ncbi:MAG: 4-hydroxythreonine-4-phosphate dehydrogenase PdxA [Desulfobacterota bacterium]|nr:4-hydroxythreonine-4-phosphate dehydrogenase PdxA [Thermodesulfobacteriota bacterium]
MQTPYTERDQASPPIIGITMGDPAGIGPEIIVKALCDPMLRSSCIPVVIGDRNILDREIHALHAPLRLYALTSFEALSPAHDSLLLVEASQLNAGDVPYGNVSARAGKALASSIQKAVELALTGTIDAVVTAPINKQSLHAAGYEFPGHTEMLAHLTGAHEVVMMLAGPRLRVVLVTIHCSLASVPTLLAPDAILKTIRITDAGLRTLFGIPQPRIAVAGLNPHAGEGGMFGNEEQTIIAPAVAEARGEGISVHGPFPPDTLFYHAATGAYDVVVCMYHDQGLIPLKMMHFDEGVNITLGLPIIRTSVDHGTAYDIAGKGIARPASMLHAVRLAVQMVMNRRRSADQCSRP